MMSEPQRRGRKAEFRPYRLGPAVPRHERPWDGAARNGWELVLSGELTDKEGELHQKLVDVPRGSSGIVYFDSCGGSAYIGLALATLIRLRGLRATGIVVGECSSAALVPFAACATRYVTPHSCLLFHPIRWQSEEQVRLEEAAEWARHFQELEADQDRLLARLFGCEDSLIEKWTRPGRFVRGAELATAGLAQMIDLFSGTCWEQMRRAETAEARLIV